MWEFNYGEWTEAYVFLRLLGNGRIYGANSNFERDESVYLDILNILRYEKDHMLQFEREMATSTVNAKDNGLLFRIMAYSELTEKAEYLYDAIKKVTVGNRKFAIPEIEKYLKELKFSQPKVPKLPKDVAIKYGDKTDIIITIEDSVDHAVLPVGFSIKSHLGSSSSLFNTAPASKFIYEIVGCNEAEMNELNGNQIDSEMGMMAYIKNHSDMSLKYVGTSEKFKANLDFIELTMDKIISCALLVQTGYYEKAKSNDVKDIVERVAEINPVQVARTDVWYKAKMKDFLFAAFSGLTATNPWDGRKRLSGGYIDVNAGGEMLYYRAVSDDVFNTYLYEHTYIDRPSRGVNKNFAKLNAKAHLEGREPSDEEIQNVMYKIKENNRKEKNSVKGDWGYVYQDGDKYYIAINFQVRFR